VTTEVLAGAVWPRRDDVRAVVAPRWRDGTVGALQLTVDQVFAGELPADFVAVLDEASAAGRLVGHGVMASPYTWPRDGVAVGWLQRAKQVLARWPVRFLVDHVGCCRVGDWHAAPLPLPASSRLVGIVVDHLSWLRDELGVPVGLENLALAASPDDVLLQPELVEAMLEPVDGVLLLDLHNLYCSAVNMGFDPLALMERWPLHRVRQIHVAGGRMQDGLRRDTHDGPVPEEVWELLPEAVARCEQLEVVVWERLRGQEVPAEALDAELLRLASTCAQPPTGRRPAALPPAPPWPQTDPVLAQQALFAAARSGDRALLQSAVPDWWTDDRTFATAVEVTARWGRAVPS
jgi:uncharacterized protein (UPF0276 family)